MILDRLLELVDLRVSSFALFELRGAEPLRVANGGEAQLHFVLAGHGEITRPGFTGLVGPTSLVLGPPRLRYSVRGVPTEEGELGIEVDAGERVVRGTGPARLLMVSSAVAVQVSAAALFEDVRAPLVENFASEPRMREIFTAMLSEHRRPRPGGAKMVEALMMQCLVIFLRRWTAREDAQLRWLRAIEDARLRPAVDAMVSRPQDAHELAGLARVAGMSRSSFSASFTAAFGRSPMVFLRELRMREAARLLRQSGLPIKTIAAQVGYQSRSQFSRAFKEQYREDPATYRASRRER